ncbi:hypothetical protein LEWO105114_06935 [Legionella worsleiensis]|nr:Uncharacterised protein [Legionella worsleiensis]
MFLHFEKKQVGFMSVVIKIFVLYYNKLIEKRRVE